MIDFLKFTSSVRGGRCDWSPRAQGKKPSYATASETFGLSVSQMQ